MEKNRRGQWSEYAGGPGGATGSEAADEARRMRQLDPEDAGPWQPAVDATRWYRR